VRLAKPAAEIDVAEIVGQFEGRSVLLECFVDPDVCVLEPGCRLRRKLQDAEKAFYDTLSGTTLADLVARPKAGSGLAQLNTD
jgi:Rrf2 family nitric oxide-sensitive transcriptional repressor